MVSEVLNPRVRREAGHVTPGLVSASKDSEETMIPPTFLLTTNVTPAMSDGFVTS